MLLINLISSHLHFQFSITLLPIIINMFKLLSLAAMAALASLAMATPTPTEAGAASPAADYPVPVGMNMRTCGEDAQGTYCNKRNSLDKSGPKNHLPFSPSLTCSVQFRNQKIYKLTPYVFPVCNFGGATYACSGDKEVSTQYPETEKSTN
jgi:hypothetical protein